VAIFWDSTLVSGHVFVDAYDADLFEFHCQGHVKVSSMSARLCVRQQVELSDFPEFYDPARGLVVRVKGRKPVSDHIRFRLLTLCFNV